jgi:hypothetical protein
MACWVIRNEPAAAQDTAERVGAERTLTNETHVKTEKAVGVYGWQVH